MIVRFINNLILCLPQRPVLAKVLMSVFEEIAIGKLVEDGLIKFYRASKLIVLRQTFVTDILILGIILISPMSYLRSEEFLG